MREELLEQLEALIRAHVRAEGVEVTEFHGATFVVADLMHLADERGWDWARIRQQAGEVYRDDIRLESGHGDDDDE